MEKEQNFIKMDILVIVVIISMGYLKEIVNIYLKMIHIIEVNLKMVCYMEKEENFIKMKKLDMRRFYL